MAFIDAVLDELDRESASTTRILERVPYDKLDWQPHAKSMSLGQLAWHIASVPSRVGDMLREGSFAPSRSKPSGFSTEPDSIAAEFRKNIDALREQLKAMPDEEFREIVAMKRGEQVVVQFPKAGLVRVILLNHSYHHRGQLTVYLRLLDVPVPAMYGVSADEDPFAPRA